LNDIFDIINDDEQDDTEEVENITEEYNTDFDFDYINTNVDDEEMMMMIEDEKVNIIYILYFMKIENIHHFHII
jgi:hypothetical protein